MISVSSPAPRPPHPHGCRKRASGQGHALSGRFAGLDQMPLLSDYGYLRATDEEASGGGSFKGSSRFRDTNTALPPARRSDARAVMCIMPTTL